MPRRSGVTDLRLFRQGEEVTGKKPRTLITDELHACHLAYKREFYAHEKPVTNHVEHIRWRRDKGNEKMESFNGTARAERKPGALSNVRIHRFLTATRYSATTCEVIKLWTGKPLRTLAVSKFKERTDG